MGTAIGVWIDHRGAVIVSVTGERVEVARVFSGAKGHGGVLGNPHALAAHNRRDAVDAASLDRERDDKLRRFYRRVIDKLRGAGEILILGPGESGVALARMLKRSKSVAGTLVGIEGSVITDEAQIVAKVRDFFRPKAGRFALQVRALREGAPIGGH